MLGAGEYTWEEGDGGGGGDDDVDEDDAEWVDEEDDVYECLSLMLYL